MLHNFLLDEDDRWWHVRARARASERATAARRGRQNEEGVREDDSVNFVDEDAEQVVDEDPDGAVENGAHVEPLAVDVHAVLADAQELNQGILIRNLYAAWALNENGVHCRELLLLK